MYSRKRQVYRQKGRGGYSNGFNPNQSGGTFYTNGIDPNQEGGARTKGSLKRQYAANALLSLAASGTPLRIPGSRGKVRNITNILNNMSPPQASTPSASPMSDGSPIGAFSPVSSPEYTLSDFSPAPVKTRQRTKRTTTGSRKRKRTANDNDHLLMVKQFKIANPQANVSNLHALAGGWKLHGKLGEERKGYRAACLRMGALIGEKMYANPNSPWMTKMKNGVPFDLLQEYNKLKQPSNVTAVAVADAIVRSPKVGTRRSKRKRKAPVMFGRGKNQKGGFLPLLAMAAPAIAGTLGKLF